MNPPNRRVSLSRRQFLGRVSLMARAAPALYALPAFAIVRSTVEPAPMLPILSIHVDQPYLDKSGTAVPYVPPLGTRSGQAMSELSEVEYLSRYLYF